MNKFASVVLVLALAIIFFISVVAKADADADAEGDKELGETEGEVFEEQEQPSSSSSTVEEVLMDAISILTVTSAASPTSTPYSIWDSLTTLIHQAQSYLFPPKIHFRQEWKEADGEGANAKVKEAISKSMESSKETLEDSAKSAAQFATQTLNTKSPQRYMDVERIQYGLELLDVKYTINSSIPD